jgi:KDO2-lipid IV(A) lauroyltransferase
MSSKSDKSPFAPRYWSTQIAMGLLWLICRWLPFGWIVRIGEKFGKLIMKLGDRRRHIAEVNLSLCFPEQTEAQRKSLLESHFKSLGIGLLTTGMAWWAKDRKLRPLCQIEGLEHLQQAQERGKGVILLSAHFTDLEMSGRLLSLHHPFAVMYRPHENPVIESAFHKNREQHFSAAITKTDVRQMARALKQGMAVWYAPDQSYNEQNSALVPFFNVPAATNLGTSRLAKVSGASVLPFFGFRLPGNAGYRLVIQPAIENFPSQDPEADAKTINQIIEDAIKGFPEQYFWVHRRFKRRSGMQDPYTNQ